MMSISWRRIQVIIRKELKDALRNYQVLMMVVVPIGMALLYQNMQSLEGNQLILIFPILMSFGMTGTIVQSMIIAEEKEKHTLRALMLSPATAIEVMIGKSFLSFFLTLLTIFLTMLVTGLSMGISLLFWCITLLCILFFITVGTIVGLMSKSLTETAYLGMPIMFLMGLSPIFAPLINKAWLTKIVSFLPTAHYLQATELLMKGKTFIVGSHWLNITIWLILAVIICLFVFKRNRIED
ncbi:ABC-2 type transport system permease protein [Seinonella peptonophila]|uniref:ABC-2 type transport system permease protein n=1 Tax=Seinonella peptonophila TaxID=112248 RepID=A0A1M4WGP7_9BACL|nr:ABC transporter permease [Seinonella peptonophila]SHE80406.1 ABC-2 type transport system permease protein [Seinonella peptonophila]